MKRSRLNLVINGNAPIESEVFLLNIIDVAKVAGVSKTTVSRVLAGSKEVKPETRQKVLETIKELGYTPNTSAQILAGKRNRVIGVISTLPVSDPFYGYMNELIASECEKRNYGTIYTVVPKKEIGCSKEVSLLYGKVDAYIIVGNEHVRREDVERILQMKMPVALFKTDLMFDGALTVDSNNVQGGSIAAEYLLSRGYKKIGYLHGNKNDYFKEGAERYKGFVEALEKQNCSITAEFQGDRSFLSAYELADEVLAQGLNALFCETDIMAHGITQAFLEKGISVPETLAVLGFDNFKFRNYETQIRLSTVAQPIEKMAEYIVNSLILKIEEDIDFKSPIFFDTRIIERKTT